MNPLLFLIILVALINAGYYGCQHAQSINFSSIRNWIDFMLANESILFLSLFVSFTIIMVLLSIVSTMRNNKWYKSLPNASEYASRYLKDNKKDGFRCSACGSRSIRNWGRTDANDSERIFICNHCGKHLYRN